MTELINSAHQKVIAAIPCYNEDRFIGSVVLKAREFVEQVVVVDSTSKWSQRILPNTY